MMAMFEFQVAIWKIFPTKISDQKPQIEQKDRMRLRRLELRIRWPDATSLPANPSAALLQHGVSWSSAALGSKFRKECSGGAIKM